MGPGMRFQSYTYDNLDNVKHHYIHLTSNNNIIIKNNNKLLLKIKIKYSNFKYLLFWLPSCKETLNSAC